jgi:predicted NAD-dependent protein-ADP-ribosyltransferase YbiA (DUF1768 family)
MAEPPQIIEEAKEREEEENVEPNIDAIRAFLAQQGYGPEDYNIVEGEIIIKPKQTTQTKAKTKAKAKPTVSTTKITRKNQTIEQNPLQRFYSEYGTNPAFQYTPDGNLQLDTEVLRIQPFGPLTAAERLELETQQAKQIQDEEIVYDLALAELRRVYAEYKTANEEQKKVLAIEIYNANKEVRTAVAARSSVAFPERWTNTANNPETRLIDMRQPKEIRKMGFDVFIYKRNSAPLSTALGTYRAQPLMDQAGGMNEETLVSLSTPENTESGHFHPIHELEFTVHGTLYASPYQAYEGERFRELENEPLRKQILGTRSARSIRSLVSKEYTQPNDPLGLWIDILEALYTQKKELGDALIDTGSATFVNQDPTFVSTDYISALETVRTKLQEGRVEKEPEVATESVITREDQEKAKKAAIIHTFRKRRF